MVRERNDKNYQKFHFRDSPYTEVILKQLAKDFVNGRLNKVSFIDKIQGEFQKEIRREIEDATIGNDCVIVKVKPEEGWSYFIEVLISTTSRDVCHLINESLQ